jgi:opacity protein-like surface antigen
VPARAFDAATFTCDEQENLVKTLGIIFGVLAVGLPGPAYAQGWYIGLGLAPAWLDTEFKYPDASRLSPDVDTSLMVNGAVGYKWQGWRFEAEPYWTEADTSKSKVSGGLTVNPLMTVTNSNEALIDGNIRAQGVLFNAAYDLPLDNNFAFTFGGGVGWANVSPSMSTRSGSSLIHDGQSAFAWQFLAGFTYAVNPNFEFQVDYRYTGISDTDHRSAVLVVNPLSTPASVNGVSAGNTSLQAIMFSVRWYPSPVP